MEIEKVGFAELKPNEYLILYWQSFMQQTKKWLWKYFSYSDKLCCKHSSRAKKENISSYNYVLVH